MRNRSAKRRNRNKLARSSANLRKNSLSLGRLIVAEDGTDVPVFLSEMSRPAGSLFLLTGTLLAGLLGDVTGEDVGMAELQASKSKSHKSQGWTNRAPSSSRMDWKSG